MMQAKVLDGIGRKRVKFFLRPSFQFIIFFTLNILFFVNILIFHSKIDFHSFNYKVNSHHFIRDGRTEGKPFNLINSLGQYDAQWYLKIAKKGYPVNPKIMSLNDGGDMEGFTYAFFPLYPVVIGFLDLFIKNVELSAFFISIVFIVLNFASFIYIVKKHFGLKISLRASYLLFFFPFSVFFRSYFAEGVLLFLLIWFAYFLSEKEYLKSSFFLSLINITKGTAFLLNVIFVYLIFIEFRKGKIVFSKVILLLLVMFTPLIVWMLYNYVNTGSLIYFLSTRSFSGVSHFTTLPFMSAFHNLALLFLFPLLSFHLFHTSQVDVLMVLVFLLLLIKSRKVLPTTYFLIAMCLWLSPLLVKDLMSYSRYQSINFPIFIYLAQALKGKSYAFVFFLFLSSLAIISLFFVNWWWIG